MGGYNATDPVNTSGSSSGQQNQQKLQTMVTDLLQSLHVSSVDQLDCTKIPQDQLIKLGDAWMDVQVPNESAHEAMDTMMGGEGSESLNNMHIGMAERYLGCQNASSTNNRYGWGHMMEGGAIPMMGWGQYGYGNQMQEFGWGLGLLGFFFWLVVFVDLILLGIFLWKKIKK